MADIICSGCHESFMNCKCEQFHPNIEVGVLLNAEEVSALLNYFYQSAGYIDHISHPLVHTIIKRLENFNGKETRLVGTEKTGRT
jgi:hypothetical protein